MDKEMKYFDAFSGYGGFSLGIKQAYDDQHSKRIQKGRNNKNMPNARKSRMATEPLCIGFSEIDKYAVQVYSKHFPYEQCEKCRESLQGAERDGVRPIGNIANASGGDDQQSETRRDRVIEQSENNCQCKHKLYGSITDIDASTLPDFDLFVGGFPCQAFSIAGKRAGFEDTRGTLIYDVLRIVKEKHPRTVLLENVKGLLSHDGGRTFKTIISALAELGYAVEWQDCEYGAPEIDPKRPYGNSNCTKDILEILGLPADEENESLNDYARNLHKSMETALQIFLSTQSFEVGKYELEGYGNNWKKVIH